MLPGSQSASPASVGLGHMEKIWENGIKVGTPAGAKVKKWEGSGFCHKYRKPYLHRPGEKEQVAAVSCFSYGWTQRSKQIIRTRLQSLSSLSLWEGSTSSPQL